MILTYVSFFFCLISTFALFKTIDDITDVTANKVSDRFVRKQRMCVFLSWMSSTIGPVKHAGYLGLNN